MASNRGAAKPRTPAPLPKRGAKPATIAKMRADNERRHAEALKRGSRYALATERRRAQEAARLADAAAAGSGQPAPAGDAKPPPDAPGAAGDPAPRPTLGRVLLSEGITGAIRRRLSR